MKPHVSKGKGNRSAYWVCVGYGFTGIGGSPKGAFHAWKRIVPTGLPEILDMERLKL